MNRSLLGMVVVLTSLWAGPLRAQASAPILASTEPPVDEVVRGFFLGLDVGPAFLTVGARRPPAGTGPSARAPRSGWRLAGTSAATSRCAIFFAGNNYSANADYIGNSGGTASGDFSSVSGGLDVRWNFLGFADSQGVQRTWLYLKGRSGAWPSSSPTPCSPRTPPATTRAFLCSADPGCSTTRAFDTFRWAWRSWGTYLVKPKTFGFAITPNLLYAF